MNTLENTIRIGTKLEKETSTLTVLKDRVDRYHGFSDSMSSILTSFEERLGKLEQTILPVYNETEHLQKRQQNLDATLQSLEVVLSHYDASQEVCGLIHKGPSEGSITTFLDALDKLRVAMEYFLKNNSQSVELENVNSLYNAGCESLNNHYKLLLKKHSQPMKPVDLLDLIYIEEDSSNEDCSSIKQISPNVREELHTISHWFEQNLRRDFIEIYSKERSDIVFKSLQHLKDHQKSGSWGNEPLKKQFGRPEPKKTSARLQNIFERKANKMLLRATQTIQSTAFSLKKNASYSEHLSAEDNLESDQELDKYLILLLGLQRLLVWERTLCNEIIPLSKHTETFTKLANSSIEMIVKDAEAITNRVIRNIAKKEWTPALGIFSALKRVIILQPDMDRICDNHQKEQLRKVLNKLQQTGCKALEQFLEVIKADSGTNLVGTSTSSVPKDATVHEMTSNTIWFVENLFEHFDVIGGIFETDILFSSQLDTILMKKSLTAEEKNKALLAIYIKKVLSELNLTIITKCEQYTDAATKYLFRLNNIHYILKSIQRSNLLDLVILAEPNCEKSYLDIIRELKISYQKSWSKLLSNISPLEDLPRPINLKVKDKERAILKERFSNFNKDLEDSCKIQRGISVPDVILREGIKRDNIEHILPKYYKFYEVYAEVQFSKNPGKYIKYKPHEVNAMLNKLFDDSL